MGKLAMWRIQTHSQFGGTWLSDYVPNRLGGFLEQPNQQERAKPYCSLIEQDGNIFNLMGAASRTLREHGMGDQAKEMCDRITGGNCHSYHEALRIISEYVETEMSIPQNPSKEKRRSMPMSDNITEPRPSWEIIHGDALKVLCEFAPNTFDAVITDPPYASGGPDPGGEKQVTDKKYSSMGESAPPPFDGDSKDQRS